MSLRAMCHYELCVIPSQTTFIVIPAEHEKLNLNLQLTWSEPVNGMLTSSQLKNQYGS
ncbi:hypothetical protein [Vibrio atlanticus]|uniref:hypothetical protein n=1 Tax=Vibrio atlanticus TaxID=693153 RepID=UPI0013C40CE1|nr:hypothetical protein [Vibrio atlanticus]